MQMLHSDGSADQHSPTLNLATLPPLKLISLIYKVKKTSKLLKNKLRFFTVGIVKCPNSSPL